MKNRRKFILGYALVAACAALSSAAVQAQASPEVEVLARLTGSEGEAPGTNPVMPPVWLDGQIYGATFGGPVATPEAPFQGMAYAMAAADGEAGGYTAYPMGSLGISSTTLVLGPDGGLIGGISRSLYNSTGALTKLFYQLGDEGPSFWAQPDGQDAWQRNISPRGQLAADDDGNIYFGAGGSTGIPVNLCQEGSPGNVLWRLTPAKQLQKVVDFCKFVTGDTRPTQTHDKGGMPIAMAWSQTEQALYVLTQISAQGQAFPDTPDDYLGRSVGTLVRIDKDTLETGAANDGVVVGDNIVVLHGFQRGRDGVPSSGGSVQSSLVEDGEWLYGTAQTNDPGTGATPSAAFGGTVWRVRKGDPASFQVLHAFGADTSADPSEAADGVHPFGPLVRAADGNIYGTTANDTSLIFTNSGGLSFSVGAGTVFRIRVGQAPDRSDDTLEIIHRFDAATEGAGPVGLSAGPIIDGAQILYGANTYNGNGEPLAATSASGGVSGNGSIFQVAVPLPPVDVSAFSVNGSSAVEVQPQATLSFVWESTGAQVCLAGGSWEGSKAASDQAALLAPATPGEYVYTLVCRSDAGVESEEKQVSVTVQAPAPEPEPEPEPEPTPEPEDSDSGGGSGGAFGGLLVLLMAAGAIARRRV